MKKVLIGSLLGSLVMFLWGAIFWASPFPYKFLGKTSDDKAVGASLLIAFPKSGTYIIPGQYNDPKVTAELAAAGPIATVHIRNEGREMQGPLTLGMGFLHEFIVILCLALTMRSLLPALTCYGSRLQFISLTGIIFSLFANGSMPIWWGHPWIFYFLNIVYDSVAWTLVGLVLAKFVQPEPAPDPNGAKPAA